jgi:hypothetical protein
MGRRVFELVGITTVLAVIAAAGLLIWLYPWHPTTVWGWLLFVVLALPVTAAGEWVGHAVLGNRFARSIGRNAPPGRISWARISSGVVALLLTTAAVMSVLALVSIGLSHR